MRRRLVLAAGLPLGGCMAPPSGAGGAAMELVSGVLALAIVLGLAWASLRLLKRFNVGLGVPPGAPGLRFLRALPLGPRERLVVVAYEGEVLLLGVSAGQVTLLDRRPEASGEARDNPS
jgi:flagellar biosynthetic protein FliO